MVGRVNRNRSLKFTRASLHLMTPLVVVDGRCSSTGADQMLQCGTKQIGSSFYESIEEVSLKGDSLSWSFLHCFTRGVDLTRRKKNSRTQTVDGKLVAYGASFTASLEAAREEPNRHIVWNFLHKFFSAMELSPQKFLNCDSNTEPMFVGVSLWCRVWKPSLSRPILKPWGEAWKGKPKEDNIC